MTLLIKTDGWYIDGKKSNLSLSEAISYVLRMNGSNIRIT